MKKIVLLILISTSYTFAQDSLRIGNFDPPKNPPIIKAFKTSNILKIDGILDENSWEKASSTTNFFRSEPRQGGKLSYKTEVKVLFDDKNLYFGVFAKDSLGRKGVRVQDLRRDFQFGENDIFLLQLDPQNLKQYCVSFQTTPYGNQRDAQVFNDNVIDNDWDALWKVRTTINDSGYVAEFAIPFKTLRYQKTDSLASWGLTYGRLARRDYEFSVFPAIPQSFTCYRMTYAAKLNDLELPKPSLNIRANPYLLYQSDLSVRTDNTRSVTNSPKIGGDVKWAINPNTVLDVTFNTDFAQADVDRAVNNTTRFNVFFLERRQFFLENSGIYAGAGVEGINPFFSRAIGLANSQFNADPVPIDIGLRYTQRTKKNTLAGLYVHQGGNENQGGANFGVLRYLQNYGKQNNVGVMLTHRMDEANIERGILQRNNTTLTVDGLVRPNDSWTITYLLSSSRDDANNDMGYAGNLFVGYTPQKAYVGWLSKMVSERYIPGMGLVFANNTIHHNPGGYFIWRPKGKLGKIIRRWDPGVFVNYYQNADDFKLQEANLVIFPVYIIFNSNALLEYTILPTWQAYNFEFDILGRTIPIGKFNVVRHLVRYRSDQSKKASFNFSNESGGYFNGNLSTWRASGRLAPIPHLALTADYEHNNFSNFGTENDSFSTDLYSVGLRLAANPRLQLSSFYQFNTFDNRGRINLRGSWEFSPLSFLYLVFNENNVLANPNLNRSFISKISYMKQF